MSWQWKMSIEALCVEENKVETDYWLVSTTRQNIVYGAGPSARSPISYVENSPKPQVDEMLMSTLGWAEG